MCTRRATNGGELSEKQCSCDGNILRNTDVAHHRICCCSRQSNPSTVDAGWTTHIWREDVTKVTMLWQRRLPTSGCADVEVCRQLQTHLGGLLLCINQRRRKKIKSWYFWWQDHGDHWSQTTSDISCFNRRQIVVNCLPKYCKLFWCLLKSSLSNLTLNTPLYVPSFCRALYNSSTFVHIHPFSSMLIPF